MKEILYFGKGDIIVTSTLNTLIIKQVNETLQVGETVGQNLNTFILNQFALPLNNLYEVGELRRLLGNAYQDKIFTYKHLTFDFTNYNRKSVDCIMDQLSWIEKFMPKANVV